MFFFSPQFSMHSALTIVIIVYWRLGGESAAAPTGKSFRFVRACERAGGRRARDQLRLPRGICRMIARGPSSPPVAPRKKERSRCSFLKSRIVFSDDRFFFSIKPMVFFTILRFCCCFDLIVLLLAFFLACLL